MAVVVAAVFIIAGSTRPALAKSLRDKHMPEWAVGDHPHGCAVGIAPFSVHLNHTKMLARNAALVELKQELDGAGTTATVTTAVVEPGEGEESGSRTVTTEVRSSQTLVTLTVQSDYVREHWISLVCLDPFRTLATSMPEPSTPGDWTAFQERVEVEYSDLLREIGGQLRAFVPPASQPRPAVESPEKTPELKEGVSPEELDFLAVPEQPSELP